MGLRVLIEHAMKRERGYRMRQSAKVGKIEVKAGQVWLSSGNGKSWKILGIESTKASPEWAKVRCEYVDGNPKNAHPGQRFSWILNEFYVHATFGGWKVVN